MDSRSSGNAPPTFRWSPRARATIGCAQCGEPIFAADWSEQLDELHVRHLWACRACDYQFETLAKFPSRPAA